MEGLSAAWMLPIVTAVVCAATGGVVASVLPPEQARITIITSYAYLIERPYDLRTEGKGGLDTSYGVWASRLHS
jgi:hypothetical protein